MTALPLIMIIAEDGTLNVLAVPNTTPGLTEHLGLWLWWRWPTRKGSLGYHTKDSEVHQYFRLR